MIRKDLSSSLYELRSTLHSSENKRVSLREIMDSVSDYELGILLVVTTLSLIVILPIGAIPGIPAFAGISLCVMFMMLLFATHHHDTDAYDEPHNGIPDIIRFKKKNILSYTQYLSRYLEKVETWSRESRLEILNSQISLKIACLIGIVLSIIMIVIGFIPFLPTILMLPVILFSLGFLLNDGLFTAVGYGASLIVMSSVVLLIP